MNFGAEASFGFGGGSYSGGGGGLPGVTIPFIGFRVGDGQTGTPAATTSTLIAAALQGQNLVNKQLLVIREGIALLWNTAVDTNDIRRYNSGGMGGFTLQNGVVFAANDRYQIFIIGTNSTIET